VKKDLKVSLPSVDELFTTEEQRQEKKLESVQEIAANELQPFNNHPFQVKNDEEMTRLCDSISEYGVLTPLMARPKDRGGYEIISGHRRKAAAEILGLDKLPVLVRDITDDEAILLMVDCNIQRENLLLSEKAFAYKMKVEAIKRQGARTDLTSAQLVPKLPAREIIANEAGVNRMEISRYIHLTELVKPILNLVDNQRIAFTPAVELSYLTKEEQAELWDIMQQEDCTPSLSQAVRMKKLSQEAKLTTEAISAIMGEEKANQKPQVRISTEKLAKYFPKGYSVQQMEDAIIKLLEERLRKKQRDRDGR
jgi:ParB family transcriptional regulator, chromosome partitioning protein